MAAPDPFAGTPEQFTALDWKEAVSDQRPGDDLFAQDQAECALTALVPGAKIRGAVRYCLGYNAVTTSAPYLIRRTNPVQHPYWPNLFCTAVSASPFAPDPAGGTLKRLASVGANPAAPSVPASAKYKQYKLVCKFNPLPYGLLEDDQVDQFTEGARNAWFEMEPSVTVLALPGFQFTFAEGAGIPGGTGYSNPIGVNAVPGEVGQTVVRSDLRLNWDKVPENHIFVTNTTAPANILYCLGTLNSRNFYGYPAGTLLLTGAKFTRFFNGTKVNFTDAEPYNYYRVEFAMTFFDPPKGYTWDAVAGAPVRLTRTNPVTGEPTDPRGWNCTPWKGDAAAAGGVDKNAGYWFAYSYSGTLPLTDNSVPGLFRYSNFMNLMSSPQNALIAP